jgi:hypothetical protein
MADELEQMYALSDMVRVPAAMDVQSQECLVLIDVHNLGFLHKCSWERLGRRTTEVGGQDASKMRHAVHLVHSVTCQGTFR